MSTTISKIRFNAANLLGFQDTSWLVLARWAFKIWNELPIASNVDPAGWKRSKHRPVINLMEDKLHLTMFTNWHR